MIVRINPIDIAKAEAESGWPPGGLMGGFSSPWPAAVKAFELVILSEDEKRQPLTDAFRHHQLRQMLPQAAFALRESGQTAIVRLDGPLAYNELLPAWRHLTEPHARGRFAFAAAAKVDDSPADVTGSVRIVPSPKRLAAICSDPDLGLERSVRLRLLFGLELSTAALLETNTTDDPRWQSLLAECSLVIGTTANLRSIHIFTRHFDVTAVKTRVMQRLVAVARGEPAVP